MARVINKKKMRIIDTGPTAPVKTLASSPKNKMMKHYKNKSISSGSAQEQDTDSPCKCGAGMEGVTYGS